MVTTSVEVKVVEVEVVVVDDVVDGGEVGTPPMTLIRPGGEVTMFPAPVTGPLVKARKFFVPMFTVPF